MSRSQDRASRSPQMTKRKPRRRPSNTPPSTRCSDAGHVAGTGASLSGAGVEALAQAWDFSYSTTTSAGMRPRSLTFRPVPWPIPALPPSNADRGRAGDARLLRPALRACSTYRLWGALLPHCVSTDRSRGARIKTLRSHLSVNDLAKLVASGAVPAGPAPLPPIEDGHAIEIERLVSRGGLVCLGPHRLLAAEILGGQLAGIRIEPATLMFYDPTTRGAAAHPAQPAHPRSGRPAAGSPPGRATVPPTLRAGPCAAPRQRHRRHRRLRPEDRPRSHPRRPHRRHCGV